MKTLRYLLPLLAGASLLAACDPFQACTEMGCAIDEGVDLTLKGALAALGPSAPLTIEVCVAETCDAFVVTEKEGEFECDASGFDCYPDGADLKVLFPAPVDDEVTVRVTISDAAGDELFEESQSVGISESAPNGEGCEPICRNGSAVFAVEPVSK